MSNVANIVQGKRVRAAEGKAGQVADTQGADAAGRRFLGGADAPSDLQPASAGCRPGHADW